MFCLVLTRTGAYSSDNKPTVFADSDTFDRLLSDKEYQREVYSVFNSATAIGRLGEAAEDGVYVVPCFHPETPTIKGGGCRYYGRF